MVYKFALLCLISICLVGCGESDYAVDVQSSVIAEGVIWYVQYETGECKIRGFTRSQHGVVLPGGHGGLNVDAYGKLTTQFLIVTFPRRKDLGPLLIPTNRLLSIQFGDGGVKGINEKLH